MELVSIVREVFQNGAERAASYRLGQNVLRHIDRALWTVEKSARWAVPPPLDQDERPQPELIRPLPWVLFLVLLMVLRVTRELLSLVNLALGKPPIRSADMVSYIQGKRRYVRALKYQGGRALRARGRSARSLLDLLCWTRAYGNNNTVTRDEVIIVKGGGGVGAGGVVAEAGAGPETTMERLIEKMMVDVDADSDDSHSYTLTNVTSVRSDKSDYTDSEHEIAFNKESKPSGTIEDDSGTFSKQKNMATSTPEKNNHVEDVTADTTAMSEMNKATYTFLLHESQSETQAVTKRHPTSNGQTAKSIKTTQRAQE